MTAVAPQPASGLRKVLADRQTVVFLVATGVLSWGFIPVSDGGLLPHGPMLAALLVLALVSRRPGLSGLWRQLRTWRVGWRWYVIAPGLFLAMHAVALTLGAAAGLTVSAPATVWSAPALLAVAVTLLLLGGQWEEPGWLGYLLHRLGGLSPLMLLLAAGLIRVVWHTPLVALGTIPWYDFVFGSLALQVIVTWLYFRTGGSLLVPMLGHLFSNLTMATFRPLVAESQRELYWLVFVLVEVAVAVAILVATKGRVAPCPR